MKPRLSLTRINQLSADSAHCADMVTPGQVDASRPFVPEEHTQLFYTPVYEKLSHEQRLRYNQLFGLRLNEYIMTLEAELIERLLAPLRRHPRVCSDGALLLALDTMVAEERRHYAGFAAFNRSLIGCFGQITLKLFDLSVEQSPLLDQFMRAGGMCPHKGPESGSIRSFPLSTKQPYGTEDTEHCIVIPRSLLTNL